MKIKVINLLNKIANKEELPQRIKYDDYEWKLGTAENEKMDYSRYDYVELFNQYLECSLIESLNDEIELLEDEEIDIKKIEKMSENIDEIGWLEMSDKINELVKAIKQLNNKISK